MLQDGHISDFALALHFMLMTSFNMLPWSSVNSSLARMHAVFPAAETSRRI